MNSKMIALTVIAIFSISTMMVSANASHSSSPAACEGDGLYDGKNGSFSQELFDMCGDAYYKAFIEGCMSVEGNTEEVCESATDAD